MGQATFRLSKSKKILMNFLIKNVTANIIGNTWQAIMGIVFVPLYIKYLGIEAYGLIGFNMTLQSMFAILDMGLGQTLNREIARLSIIPQKENEIRNLTRTLEIIYWIIAFVIGLIVIIAAPTISHSWIKTSTIELREAEQVILIMGISLAIQWPVSLYSSGLRGLQKLVDLNTINIIFSTLRGAGSVFVLWAIESSLQAFFIWQILINSLYVLILIIRLWSCIPKSITKPHFQKSLIIDIWKYAAGISGITVISALMSQLDKIVLSKFLTLEDFGYYTLASSVAMSLNRIVYPITGGVFPRITQLASINDVRGVSVLYHKSCQLISVVLFPITVFVALFSYDILYYWNQNVMTAKNTYLLTSILICGTALNALLNMPYKLQLAYGWTKLGFNINIASIIMYIPLIIILTYNFGALGSSFSWLVINLMSLIVVIQIMHKKLLQSEKRSWYLKDLAIPLIATIFVFGIGKLIMMNLTNHILYLFSLFVLFFIGLTVSAFTTPTTRFWIKSAMDLFKKKFV